MTIGQRIKKVLDNQGMTQKELAEKSGITEVAISRYVYDKRIPQTLVLIDICDTLHVSSDYLLGIRYWGLKEKENNAQILKDALNRIAELEKQIDSLQTESEDKE